MPSFRNPKAQAKHAVQINTRHGLARHLNKESGKIHSLGTERCYRTALNGLAQWVKDNKRGSLSDLSFQGAVDYLYERSSKVRQKTLDLDRQAIQLFLGEKLEYVKSKVPSSDLSSQCRAYTKGQVISISNLQTERFQISTLVSFEAGLRASELLTILPAAERAASAHREWSSFRFVGRTGDLYTVIGKGGLVRAVLIPAKLSCDLRERRLFSSKLVLDRGIIREKFYDIAGGKKFSENFSKSSKQVLGFSHGAHGLRHSYVQARLDELQGQGFTEIMAKEIVAQEVGHFSPRTTEEYLR